MPNPLSILPSRLGEFHPEEATRPGHELRTMRLLGRRRHPLSARRSRDDATPPCSGASITEPLRLVSVGPFHKAFGTAICQGDIHLHNLFPIQIKLDMVYILDFTRYFADGQNISANFLDTNDFDFLLRPSELIWMSHRNSHL